MPTVSIGAIRALVAAATSSGVDGIAIARRNVSSRQLEDPDGRITTDEYRAILADFVDATDDTIGLRAGSIARMGGALEYLARNSPTLGDALEHVVRFSRLNADRLRLEMERAGDDVLVHVEMPSEVLPEVPLVLARQNVEGVLGLVVGLGRAITETEWNPREVRFTYPEPESSATLAEYFRAPLTFRADRSGLVISASLMKLSVVRADARLEPILEACCQALVDKLPGSEELSSEITRRLARAIPRGGATVERVARSLGMSARTLQRRLADDGTSFQDLVERTRQLLAQRYLTERSISIEESALLLGYSDTRAFQRAFKRWAGVTPAEYRAAKMAS